MRSPMRAAPYVPVIEACLRVGRGASPSVSSRSRGPLVARARRTHGRPGIWRHVGGEVAEEEAGAGPKAGGAVLGVVERAAAQREAPAADALGQLVAQRDERIDLGVEAGAP